jgi:methyl-accepting chemotaxis protein
MKESSSRVSGLITSLTQNMRAIESILKLILDINDQTGLLALNAAILSAQAGKHGRGFAVVANEMKALQEKTQNSAREIAQKIAAIQSEADATVRAVNETAGQVDQSFALSRKAGEIIRSIQSSVEEVNQRILEIARATMEQSSMGTVVNRAAQDLSTAGERLASTAAEQTSSSAELLRGAEQMKGVARMVNDSTGEQSRVTRDINERLKEMKQVTGEVHRATDEQIAAAREIMEAIEVVSSMSNRNNAMANQLGDIIANLRQRSEKLKDETNKFTL